MHSARRNGLTIMEVAVLVVILAVFAFWILLPRVTHCGCPSRRLVCAANLKGIGTSCIIYANSNHSSWPVPAFDETLAGNIDYTVHAGGGEGSVRSPNRRQPSVAGPGGARQLSVTRSFWILVRSGDVTPHQFICPTAGDEPKSNENLTAYYDFSSSKAVSYGFQVPFGPRCARAMDWSDNRLAVVADRGPYGRTTVSTPPTDTTFSASVAPPRFGPKSLPWRKYNSPNHGGEGQNVLFADGHAEFRRTPIVGIDHDNIYTVASEGDGPWALTVGESPWKRGASPRVGLDCSEESPTKDSVIFP